MKVFLVYPHLVLINAQGPHLAIPSLLSYLKKHTNHEVRAIDLNIEIINSLLQMAPSNSSGLPIRRLLTGGKDNLSQAMIEAKTKEGLGHYLHTTGHDAPDPSKILGSYWQVANTDLIDTIEGVRKDPLLKLLGDAYFDKHFKDGPCVVGLSISYITQFLPAISIARFIKSINPQAHVVFGGNTIGLIKRRIAQTPALFSVVDSFIVGEGEESIAKLAGTIETGGPLAEVPNLVFWNGNKVIETVKSLFDVGKAETPDFAMLKNHKYLFPRFPRQLTLYLRTSVGCFWNRCAFCTLSLRRYQQRGIDQVLDDMSSMVEKWNPQTIYISDLSVSTQRMLHIAEGIFRRRLRVKWEAFARIDEKLTPAVCSTLSRSGCVAVFVGLESGNQRIEDLMNKGHSLDKVPAILRNLHRAGIYTSVCAIVGFPSETDEELMETLNFLKRNSHNISSVGLSTFGLNFNSRVYNDPAKYGITAIAEAENMFFLRNFPYEVASGVTNERAQQYAAAFRLNKWNRLSEKVTRRVFRMLCRAGSWPAFT